MLPTSWLTVPRSWQILKRQPIRHLPVYIDVKAPQSYLALAGTRAMAERQNIALDWHFFQGQPLRHTCLVWVDGEGRGAMHRRIRGTYVGQDIQRYAPHALKDLYVDRALQRPGA